MRTMINNVVPIYPMILVVGICALALGICTWLIAPHLFSHYVNTSWRPLVINKNDIGFSSEVMFSDLSAPEVKSVSGKAKFVDGAGPGQMTELGYIIEIVTAPLV